MNPGTLVIITKNAENDALLQRIPLQTCLKLFGLTFYHDAHYSLRSVQICAFHAFRFELITV